jgi:hypothetical protein
MLIRQLLRIGGVVGHHRGSQRRKGWRRLLLSHVVDGLVWYRRTHCRRHCLRDIEGWWEGLACHRGGWALLLWWACNGQGTAGG